MKKLFPLIALVCALCSCSCGAAKVGVANFDNVIPQPQSVVYVADAEGYTLSKATAVDILVAL